MKIQPFGITLQFFKLDLYYTTNQMFKVDLYILVINYQFHFYLKGNVVFLYGIGHRHLFDLYLGDHLDIN